MGRLEVADATALRTSVGPSLGPEKLALDELLREGTDVDANEGTIATPRVSLNDLRDALLARATRPGDEDRCVRLGDAHGKCQQAVHGVAEVDQPAQVVTIAQLPTRRLELVA